MNKNYLATYPLVCLGDIIKLDFGERITKDKNAGTKYYVYGGGNGTFMTDRFNRKDDLVVARFAMSESCVRYVSNKFWLLDSGLTFKIHSSQEKFVTKRFIELQIMQKQREIFRCARGLAQKNLDIQAFLKIKIYIPPMEKQKEIVSIASTWDKAIDMVKRRLILYNNIHSGIVQRLLGDNSNKYPLVRLEDACLLETGSRDKGGALELGVPSIGGEHIRKDGGIDFANMKYISKQHFSSMRQGKLHEGDVLLVKDGATTGKAGYIGKLNTDMAVNEHVFIMRPNKNMLSYYLYTVVRAALFQREIKKYYRGIIGGVDRSIKGIEIPLPAIERQKEIVSIISTWDKAITGSKSLLEEYKFQRRGLIQKLLSH